MTAIVEDHDTRLTGHSEESDGVRHSKKRARRGKLGEGTGAHPEAFLSLCFVATGVTSQEMVQLLIDHNAGIPWYTALCVGSGELTSLSQPLPALFCSPFVALTRDLLSLPRACLQAHTFAAFAHRPFFSTVGVVMLWDVPRSHITQKGLSIFSIRCEPPSAPCCAPASGTDNCRCFCAKMFGTSRLEAKPHVSVLAQHHKPRAQSPQGLRGTRAEFGANSGRL